MPLPQDCLTKTFVRARTLTSVSGSVSLTEPLDTQDSYWLKYRFHSAGAGTTLTARQVKENEAEGLRRIGRKLPLTVAQRCLLTKEVAALEAELAIMDACENLTHREFDKAADHLAHANEYYRKHRIRWAIRALKMFPRWTARILVDRMKS
jgi:hypothetical protein